MHYVIEALEKGQTTWVRCAVVKSTHHAVSGLRQNSEYFFRVFAENQAGLSDPRELLWHLAMQRDSRKRLSTRLLPCLVAPAVHQRLKRGPWGSQPGREWRREEKV